MIEIAIKHRQGDFNVDAEFTSTSGVVALFGPSGAGKTTVINAVAGLIRPDAGRISIQGRVLFDSATNVFVPPHLRRIGYVFQEPRLFPHLTVEKNLRFGQKIHEPLGDIVDLLGIGELLSRHPAALSGGEAQRVAIARALLSKPDILLMDEPLAALDARRKSEILPYLAQVRDSADIPIFYVSHALSEVAQLADDIVLINDGKVARSGPISEVLADPKAVRDLGVQDAGALIEATLIEPDAGDGLSALQTSAGVLYLPKIDKAKGAKVRVRIQASDVILSSKLPEGLSALNVLPATITSLHGGQGPGMAVGLKSGEDHLLARVTRRSANALELKPGGTCFAVIKSVSVAPADVGVNLP